MVAPKPDKHIAVAGGGIAGLTASLSLAQSGFRVSGFERNVTPATSGTGIQISPNAGMVLEKLGLGKQLDAIADFPDGITINDGLSGKFLTRFELGDTTQQRHGAAYRVVHRADLQDLLIKACEEHAEIDIQMGHQAIAANSATGKLQVLGVDEGQEITLNTDAVVAADGVWSKLRHSVTGAATPQFTGMIAWRAVLPSEKVPSFVSKTSTGLWLGPDAHVVHYPLQGGTKINIIAITRWQGNTSPPQNWLAADHSAGLRQTFTNWCAPVQNLISSDAEWGGWPIFATKQVGPMAQQKLCLIGDAAHAMVPFAAQGGACAIEDAAVLAQCCTENPGDLARAFSKFDGVRRSRVQKVIDLSGNNRLIYHLGLPLSLVRNVAMRLAPQEAMQRRMDWLYGWEI